MVFRFIKLSIDKKKIHSLYIFECFLYYNLYFNISAIDYLYT